MERAGVELLWFKKKEGSLCVFLLTVIIKPLILNLKNTCYIITLDYLVSYAYCDVTCSYEKNL